MTPTYSLAHAYRPKKHFAYYGKLFDATTSRVIDANVHQIARSEINFHAERAPKNAKYIRGADFKLLLLCEISPRNAV